jgi:hypothetical protein
MLDGHAHPCDDSLTYKNDSHGENICSLRGREVFLEVVYDDDNGCQSRNDHTDNSIDIPKVRERSRSGTSVHIVFKGQQEKQECTPQSLHGTQRTRALVHFAKLGARLRKGE